MLTTEYAQYPGIGNPGLSMQAVTGLMNNSGTNLQHAPETAGGAVAASASASVSSGDTSGAQGTDQTVFSNEITDESVNQNVKTAVAGNGAPVGDTTKKEEAVTEQKENDPQTQKTLVDEISKIVSESEQSPTASIQNADVNNINNNGSEAPVPPDNTISTADSAPSGIAGSAAPVSSNPVTPPPDVNPTATSAPVAPATSVTETAASPEPQPAAPANSLVSPLDNYVVTSEFGLRFVGDPRFDGFHNGIDLGAPMGTPVRSVMDGIVSRIANDPLGYGNWVEVSHHDGTRTRYGHLEDFGDIELDQEINAGTLIGTVGSTGNSSGPHLHFEVIDAHGRNIDPRNLLNF
jgi:murein DD-endopeptidase MepM/ murein hydrolase activator NlpD